jgi:hypothetical protein
VRRDGSVQIEEAIELTITFIKQLGFIKFYKCMQLKFLSFEMMSIRIRRGSFHTNRHSHALSLV